MATELYDPINTMAKISDSVLVGFSGGKDSVACLDLCMKTFKHVEAYFLYIVPGLEFQERTLKYYEDKYGIMFHRVPHFMLSDFLRYGSFRMPDLNVPMIKTVELYNYLRELTGIYWLAGGERIADSLIRRAMIKRSSSIDKDRGRFYPLAYWSKAHVMGYIKGNRLPLSTESSALGFSFRSLMPRDMAKIRDLFPEDFAKIKEWFPLVEASIKFGEYYGKIEV